MSVPIAAALLALAVVSFGGFGARRARLLRKAADPAVSSDRRLGREAPGPMGLRSGGGRVSTGRLRRWRAVRVAPRRSAPAPELGLVVTEVATRLRAGAEVDVAWTAALARAEVLPADGPVLDAHGVPRSLLALGNARAAGAVPSTIAACRLTHELGAPLAQTLEQCAYGITEAEHARAARSIALAGPRSTARLLGWLPLAGLLLGGLTGVQPLGVLLDGAWGTACLLLGAGLLALGHGWTARLVRAAARDGG